MFRSIIPFILVCLGFTLIGLSRDMPLLEWEISEIVADLPPNFHVKSSPWTTRLGESILGDPLDHSAYFFGPVYTPMKDRDVCTPLGSKPTVRLSQNDEALEQVSLSFYQNVFPRLSQWSTFLIILFLSEIYVWWIAIWYKRPISEAVIFAVIITIMSCQLFENVWRPLAGRVTPALTCVISAESHPYYGFIAFNASVSKVHYEMPIVLVAGVCLEVGAVVVIVHQIVKAIIQRKKSTQSIVG